MDNADVDFYLEDLIVDTINGGNKYDMTHY